MELHFRSLVRVRPRGGRGEAVVGLKGFFTQICITTPGLAAAVPHY